jgi:hypothetical protein
MLWMRRLLCKGCCVKAVVQRLWCETVPGCAARLCCQVDSTLDALHLWDLLLGSTPGPFWIFSSSGIAVDSCCQTAVPRAFFFDALLGCGLSFLFFSFFFFFFLVAFLFGWVGLASQSNAPHCHPSTAAFAARCQTATAAVSFT